MEAAQPHHPPTHLAGEGEALEEARRQLALLQRRIEVEEALERVRARAMAMHSSDDIASATAVVFRELDKLGIVTIRCGIAIIDGANKMIEAWVATTTTEGEVVQVLGQFPAETHPLLSGTFDAWKREDERLQHQVPLLQKSIYRQDAPQSRT